MVNAAPNRFGAQNAGVDKDALFLKVFSGEVLASFTLNDIIRNMVLTRKIASGKQAQFPVTGMATAAYYTPGTELVGGTSGFLTNERTISIDGQLIAHETVADIDILKTHFDVRNELANKLGYALADKKERQLLQLAVLAARSSATLTGGSGGTVLTNAGYGTTGSTLASAFFDAGVQMDGKGVPDNERFGFVSPALMALLAQTTAVINKDWDGDGSYSKGKVYEINNITVLKSTKLPNANLTQETGTNNTYHGNFATTVGTIIHKSALGSVSLQDVQTSVDWIPDKHIWLMQAYNAVGHGILRPECAVELKTS